MKKNQEIYHQIPNSKKFQMERNCNNGKWKCKNNYYQIRSFSFLWQINQIHGLMIYIIVMLWWHKFCIFHEYDYIIIMIFVGAVMKCGIFVLKIYDKSIYDRQVSPDAWYNIESSYALRTINHFDNASNHIYRTIITKHFASLTVYEMFWWNLRVAGVFWS